MRMDCIHNVKKGNRRVIKVESRILCVSFMMVWCDYYSFLEDLWESLEDVSKKPVATVMSTWTKQMGYPVLSVEGKQVCSSFFLPTQFTPLQSTQCCKVLIFVI